MGGFGQRAFRKGQFPGFAEADLPEAVALRTIVAGPNQATHGTYALALVAGVIMVGEWNDTMRKMRASFAVADSTMQKAGFEP